jgi:hypothetical protein
MFLIIKFLKYFKHLNALKKDLVLLTSFPISINLIYYSFNNPAVKRYKVRRMELTLLEVGLVGSPLRIN